MGKVILLIVFVLSFESFGDKLFRLAPMHKGSSKNEILSSVRSQGTSDIIIDYLIPDPEFDLVPSQNRVRINCGNSKREVVEGRPVVPYVVSKILLPPNKTISNITLTVSDSTELLRKVSLEYGTAPVRLVEGAVIREAIPDANIYNSSVPFPDKAAVLHSIQRRCGVAYAIVKIYPLSYYPSISKIVCRKSLSLKLELKDLVNRDDLLSVNLNRFDVKDFENPEMMELISERSNGSGSNSGNCNSAKSYSYVIVTNNELKNSSVQPNLKRLAEERRKKGLVDTIVTVESIYQIYDGVDKPEKIRNFIKDAYNNWKAEFVLLGGDVNVVPTRFINVVDGNVSEVASNAYYQCLDGSYNNNGNDLWGEPDDGIGGGEIDFSPDVFIGRASAETPEEMSNFISKVLKYEKDAWSKNNYLTHAEFVGEKLMNLKDSVSYGKFYMDDIMYGSDLHGYSTKGFEECPYMNFSTVYKYDDDWPSDNIEQQEFMRNRINSNNIGYINHLGHSTLKKNMKMYRGQEQFLTNSNPIFQYSQGCFVGRFEEDCFGERFISENRYGMWSAVLNSHWGIGRKDKTDGASQALQREFWDAYFGEKKLYVGECMADQREDHIHRIGAVVNDPERWGYFVSNLLGAPATKFRMYGDITKIQPISMKKTNADQIVLRLINSKIQIKYSNEKLDPVSLSVFSLSGKLIKSVSLDKDAVHRSRIEVDVSSLGAGIYPCIVDVGERKVFAKVLIQ